MPRALPVHYHPQAWGRLAWRRQDPVQSGAKPALVLLHGLGGDQEDWQATFAHLPTDRAVATVDFRGHGRSSSPEAEFDLTDLARDVADGVQAQALGDFFVVGYGLGGLVAQALAQPGPGWGAAQLRGLVLIESFAVATAKTAFRRGRYSVRLEADRGRRIQAKYFATRERFHPMIYDRLWSSVIFFDARPFLHTTALPVHHIFGDFGRDPETDRKLLLPIRPNIQLHWIAGGGHYLLHEHPAPLAQRIAEVLGG